MGEQVEKKLWYTVEETAKAIGFVPMTIYRWIQKGRLTAPDVMRTPSGRIFIRAEWVDEHRGLQS